MAGGCCVVAVSPNRKPLLLRRAPPNAGNGIEVVLPGSPSASDTTWVVEVDGRDVSGDTAQVPFSQALGESIGQATLRVVGTSLAGLSAAFHVSAAVYWLGVSDQLLSALVSVTLGATSILAVAACLTVRAARLAVAIGTTVALTALIVSLLYGV